MYMCSIKYFRANS